MQGAVGSQGGLGSIRGEKRSGRPERTRVHRGAGTREDQEGLGRTMEDLKLKGPWGLWTFRITDYQGPGKTRGEQ